MIGIHLGELESPSMFADFGEQTGPVVQSVTPVQKQTAVNTTVMQGPGSPRFYRTLGPISQGTAVRMIGTSGLWSQVEWNGQVGFVLSNQLVDDSSMSLTTIGLIAGGSVVGLGLLALVAMKLKKRGTLSGLDGYVPAHVRKFCARLAVGMNPKLRAQFLKDCEKNQKNIEPSDWKRLL